MTVWWETLTALQRFFMLLAIPATLLLLLQTALLLLGLSGGGDVDSDGDGIPDSLDEFDDCALDHDHAAVHGDDSVLDVELGQDHSLRLFSLRTLVAFFAVFGWTGVVLTRAGVAEWLAGLLAFFAGGLAMLALAWLVKLALDLQSDGNLRPGNAVGLCGTVYLTVPARRTGTGKVTLLLQGRYAELDAVTDCGSALATGTSVTVRAASEDFVLTVDPVETDPETINEMGGT